MVKIPDEGILHGILGIVRDPYRALLGFVLGVLTGPRVKRWPSSTTVFEVRWGPGSVVHTPGGDKVVQKNNPKCQSVQSHALASLHRPAPIAGYWEQQRPQPVLICNLVTQRLQCSSFWVMTFFLREFNILSKKELHLSPWVLTYVQSIWLHRDTGT